MLTLRKAADRGRTRTDWLDSAHSFSFAGYRDAAWSGFRALRVINEDRVSGGGGFGPHSHADMEILTFVLAGTLAHRDDTGWAGLVSAGEAQCMSAGTGIVHSERNASPDEELHFLQVWIAPDREGLEPSYEQRSLRGADSGLVLAASPDGARGALTLHADARVHAGTLPRGERYALSLGERHAWVQLVRGSLRVDGARLAPGDGAAVSGVEQLELEAVETSELLLFDLA